MGLENQKVFFPIICINPCLSADKNSGFYFGFLLEIAIYCARRAGFTSGGQGIQASGFKTDASVVLAKFTDIPDAPKRTAGDSRPYLKDA
jgi:hypothetical protein